MSTVQSLESALASLKTVIEGVVLAPDVSLDRRASDRIAVDRLPAVDIVNGGARMYYDITGVYRYFYQIGLRLYSKSGRAELSSLTEQITDALVKNHTLTNTCIECVLESTDPPMLFSGSGSLNIADLYLRLRLEENYS